jgi:hypothetical protein
MSMHLSAPGCYLLPNNTPASMKVATFSALFMHASGKEKQQETTPRQNVGAAM